MKKEQVLLALFGKVLLRNDTTKTTLEVVNYGQTSVLDTFDVLTYAYGP